jgi:amidophosphoribosyltransferase
MCGILAIFSNSNHNINTDIQTQLKHLQNRGQDSYGYYLYNTIFKTEKYIGELGLIQKHHIPETYNVGIGHTRYATSYSNQKNSKSHIQPIMLSHPKYGNLSFCFNGNLNNLETIASLYQVEISNIPDINDTLILQKILASSSFSKIEELATHMIKNIRGVFNLLIYQVSQNNLYILKDRSNNRPLCIGKNDTGYCISSESVALGNYNYQFEIEGGQLLKINSQGLHKIYQTPNINKYQKKCLFEYIYLQNKNSLCHPNITIQDIREDLGEELARQENLTIDIKNKKDIVVIGAPNTAIPIGQKYAKCLDLEYFQFIEKRRGTVRSFIKSNNQDRLQECYRKFQVNPSYPIVGKIVIFVDDSLVRGNTIKTIVDLLNSLNPLQVHIRIASPEVKNACYFGIDIPTGEELIMNSYNTASLAKKLGATSINFLKTDNMAYVLKNKLGINKDNICMSCFNGEYSKFLDF